MEEAPANTIKRIKQDDVKEVAHKVAEQLKSSSSVVAVKSAKVTE